MQWVFANPSVYPFFQDLNSKKRQAFYRVLGTGFWPHNDEEPIKESFLGTGFGRMKRDDANPERVLPKTGGGVSSSSPYNWLASFHRDLMAGAVMGGVVHTIVAPIERAKLLLQTQESNLAIVGSGRRRFKGMFDCIFRTVREEGILSLWRGNGISVIRYYPSVALNFSLKVYSKIVVFLFKLILTWQRLILYFVFFINHFF